MSNIYSLNIYDSASSRSIYRNSSATPNGSFNSQNGDGMDQDGEKPRCKFCKYTAPWVSSIHLHTKLVHDKIKDFPCNKCNYSAATRQGLDNHIKSRTHDRYSSCEACKEKRVHSCKG